MLVSELFESHNNDELTTLVKDLDLLRRKMKRPGAGDPIQFSNDFNALLSHIRSKYGNETVKYLKDRYKSLDNSIRYYGANTKLKSDIKINPDISNIYTKNIAPYQEKIARFKTRLLKKNLPDDTRQELNQMLNKEYNHAKKELTASEYELLTKNINNYFLKNIPLPDYSFR